MFYLFIGVLIIFFYFISEPAYAVVLEKLEAIQDFIYLVGPKDIEDAKISNPEWYVFKISKKNYN